MDSLFSAARQLGDEFVRVLDELAAEDGELSERGSSHHRGNSQQGDEIRHRSPSKCLPPPKRPRVGPPLALVKSLQDQLQIGILTLTNQNQLNVLIQYFTAPLASSGGGTSTHNFARDMGAMGSSQCIDLSEEQSFMFHLFLQLNYLHEADWVTSLSALIPTTGNTNNSSPTPRGPTGGHYFSGVKKDHAPKERCVRFPYALAKFNSLPKELVLIKPSLDQETMRRFYRWAAMFYQEKMQHEEKLYDYSIEMRQHKKQLQALMAGGGTPSRVKQSLPKPPPLPITRWTIGCSFKGHREGVQQLLVQQPSSGGNPPPCSWSKEEEDTSGEDREPISHHWNTVTPLKGEQQGGSIPADGITQTLMGEEVSHRNLLLTHCQRHRLFRDTSPQLLWSSLETRHRLWDLLPTSGTVKPVVIVLQSDDLDVFGCILSGVPPTRGEKQRVVELAGEEEMPFLSFFTFTPTFQFLDVEAPTMVPHDHHSGSDSPQHQTRSQQRPGGAPPQNNTRVHETELLTSPQARQPQQTTASYFMSLGEGDPPSMGRMTASKSQPNTPLHPTPGNAKGVDDDGNAGGFQAQAEVGGDGVRRQVSEVALSVDRRNEGGLTVCSRFSIPNPSAPEQPPHMMVVVLEIAENLSECRVAAKSASAEVHSGFHFNVAGNNKLSTPTAPSGGSSTTRQGSIDDLVILEDDRKLVPLRAVEVYHMDLIPVFAQGSPQQPDSGSSVDQGHDSPNIRGPSSAAPPFVVHAKDDEEREGVEEELQSSPKRIANFDLDEDEWDDVAPQPQKGGDKNPDSDEFVVLGTMY